MTFSNMYFCLLCLNFRLRYTCTCSLKIFCYDYCVVFQVQVDEHVIDQGDDGDNFYVIDRYLSIFRSSYLCYT